MENNNTSLIVGVIFIAACYVVYKVYKSQREKFIESVLHIKEINESSVVDWISKQDMEEYNESYTACVMRNDSIPQEYAQKIKLFNLKNNIALFCIYDKSKDKLVKSEFVYFENLASSFNEDFVEVQFS